MANSRKKFLDLITDCFGEDLEKKHRSRELLAAQLSEKDEDFDKCIQQLEKSAKRPKRYFAILHSSLILLGLIVVWYSSYQLFQIGDYVIGGEWPSKSGLASKPLDVLLSNLIDINKVSDSDIRCKRLAEHAFWNGMVLVVHWYLLLIMALVTWIYKKCSNSLAKKISKQMVGVFTLNDWLFVIGVGVFLPIGIYWVINGGRTVLSVQNWNLDYKNYVLPSGQSLSLLLLLLFVPMLAVAHRLQKRIPFKERERTLLIWISAGLALFSMPIFGLALVLDTDPRVVIKLGYAMQVLSLLLLIVAPITGFLIRQQKGVFAIAHHIRHRLLVTVYVVASLSMVVQMPIYQVLEKYWLAEKDTYKVNAE